MKINIGTLKNPVILNLDKLIETRLLIQAGSGGGKSYTIRKIVEEAFGKIQIIILDVEGEFNTLREKYDFILAGKTGDIKTEVRSAEMLARKLLELNGSAIIDLYELKPQDRRHYAKLFFDSLINAPKELWHPVIIILDEAHFFCPEAGEAESWGSVIDIATRGRKRGFCLVLATQRLSKLHKDAAAEQQNKMIGMTTLDIDMKRAGNELGFTDRDQILSMRELEPGEFYIFGPALTRIVTKVKIGEVKTIHPTTGQRTTYIPEPTEKIKPMLKVLNELPQEVEKELKDKKDMILKIQQLQNEKRLLEHDLKTRTIDPRVLEDASKQSFQKGYNAGMKELHDSYQKAIKQNSQLQHQIAQAAKILGAPVPITPELPKPSTPVFVPRPAPLPVLPRKPAYTPIRQPAPEPGETVLTNGEKKILAFLMTNPAKLFTKTQVGAFSGYAPNGGGFNNYLGHLNTIGLIIRKGQLLKAAEERGEEIINLIGDEYKGSISQEALEHWLKDLKPQSISKIYQVLLENPNAEYTKEELGELTGFEPNGGGFGNYIGRLISLGLAERTKEKKIRFSQELLSVTT